MITIAIVGIAVISLVGGVLIGMKISNQNYTYRAEQMEQNYVQAYVQLQMKYDALVANQTTPQTPANPIGFRQNKVG